MERAGVMHTVESIVAAILFLFFVLTVAPQAAPNTGGQEEVDRRVRNTLQVLDLNQSLRQPAIDRDLETVKDRVSDQITARSIETSGIFLNTTTDRDTFSDSHGRLFTANGSALQRATLSTWFEDAEAPNITVNGVRAANNTGTVDDYRQYTITDEVVDGTNTLNISVGGSSTVGYTVDVYERSITAGPPSNREVLTTSYIIGGVNGTFDPVEVSVLSWR